MLIDFLLFIIFLVCLIKTADWSIKYSTLLAESFNLSKFVVGYIIVAVISILPEAFIVITSALDGVPEFGLGTLLGSNVADLTLVIALVIFFSGKPLKIESKIIKSFWLQIGILLVPLLLGYDGHFTRIEGAVLFVTGLIFYYITLKGSIGEFKAVEHRFRIKYILMLLVSMACLLLAAKLTVDYGILLANDLKINPMFVGMFLVAIGTTLPEMMFSLKAARKNHDSLAVGDILGTVTADATIVVGVLAIITPFSFPHKLIYITGGFMLLSTFVLFRFMKSGKTISRQEGFLLLVLYIIFVLTELALSRF